MVTNIKNIVSNNYASGFGTLLILIPFIISTILAFISIPLEEEYSLGMQNWTPIPNNYHNMTRYEKEQYFLSSHNAKNWDDVEDATYYSYTYPFIVKQYRFPDGALITDVTYQKFLDGEYFESDNRINYAGVLTDLLSINPPLLEKIGIYGYIIRIILIVSVIIGAVEILWIG